jgi:hypothetical protein
MSRHLTTYKEIVFGVLFGVGASLIDVAMHVSMTDGEWFTELTHPSPIMAVYRVLFLLLGVGLGVLLWQRNRNEREFRRLAASIDGLRRSIAAPSILVHTNLQLILTRYEGQLPSDALQFLSTAYESSRAIQRVLASDSEFGC